MCKTPLISALFLSLRSTHLENIFQCGISCFKLSCRDIASFFFFSFFLFVSFLFFFLLLLLLLAISGCTLGFKFPKCPVFCLKEASFRTLQTLASYFLRRTFFRQLSTQGLLCLSQLMQPLKSMLFFTTTLTKHFYNDRTVTIFLQKSFSADRLLPPSS